MKLLTSASAAILSLSFCLSPALAQDSAVAETEVMSAETTTPQDAATDADAPETTSVGPDDVVARVNGEEIVLADVLAAQPLLSAEAANQSIETIFPQLLDLLIEQRLYAASAKEAGVDENAQYQRQIQFLSDQLLQQFFIESLLTASVGDEAIEAEIANLQAEIGSTQLATARQILVADTENTELAASLIGRVASGEDFAALAAEFSDDTATADNGGRMGTLVQGTLDPALDELVFSQVIGTVNAEPVETPQGLHIVIVDERFAVGPQPEQLRRRAVERLQSQALVDTQQAITDSAVIEVIGANGELVRR